VTEQREPVVVSEASYRWPMTWPEAPSTENSYQSAQLKAFHLKVGWFSEMVPEGDTKVGGAV